MGEKPTTICEKIDDILCDINMYSQKPSPAMDQCLEENPDWSVSIEVGYLLLQEIGCGDLSVLESTVIGKTLGDFYESYVNKTPISYKNREGKKSHSFIHFYGTKENCEKAMKQYQQVLGKKIKPKVPTQEPDSPSAENKSVPTIDLTSPPKVNKRMKKEILVSELPMEIKIDIIYQSMEDIIKKIAIIERDINEIKKTNSPAIFSLERNKKEIADGYTKSNKLIEAQLTAEFIKILVTKRASAEWRKMVRSCEIKDITAQQSKNIKELFLYGPKTVGAFIRALAKELFGVDRIVETLLGEDGEFLKGIKVNQDRDKLFSVDEELKLVEILKIIDPDFFTKRDAYRLLVRDKINSYGRDLKKSYDFDKASCSSSRKGKKISEESHNITSYFKKISRPGNMQAEVNKNLDENPVAGPSGVQQEVTVKSNVVSYQSSSQSSIDEY